MRSAGGGCAQLLIVEALGHTRVPFAGYRPDHRAGVELAAIDAHRAAETAADLERRFDDGQRPASERQGREGGSRADDAMEVSRQPLDCHHDDEFMIYTTCLEFARDGRKS